MPLTVKDRLERPPLTLAPRLPAVLPPPPLTLVPSPAMVLASPATKPPKALLNRLKRPMTSLCDPPRSPGARGEVVGLSGVGLSGLHSRPYWGLRHSQ